MALNKPLASIEESDLQALVDNQVSEHKTFEYKEALPGNADGDKKEFLADVSSFANASGGDLIYGVREQSGVPVELSGLGLSDVDAEILRLESCIQMGIAPRLFRIVETHPVALPSKQRYAIVIRIRKSWAAPHMVTFKNDSKFFSRNSRGKYQLDVSELRSAFLLSETAAEHIRNFRAERLGMIVAGEGAISMGENAAKLVLHMVPFEAFDPAARFDLFSLNDVNYVYPLEPLRLHRGGYRSPQFNFDGLLCELQDTYTQVFRNGSIEAVDTTILGASRERQITSGGIYERRLLEAIKRYLAAQKQLGVEPPIFVMISLLGVKDFKISFDGLDNWIFEAQEHLIDRADLKVPEIMIDDFDSELTEVMKPAFDTIANATRWSRSMTYNESGKSLLTGL
jgi:hypothetical protein